MSAALDRHICAGLKPAEPFAANLNKVPLHPGAGRCRPRCLSSIPACAGMTIPPAMTTTGKGATGKRRRPVRRRRRPCREGAPCRPVPLAEAVTGQRGGGWPTPPAPRPARRPGAPPRRAAAPSA
jgi:hypothetical protein